MSNVAVFFLHFTVLFGALVGAFLAGPQALQVFSALCAVFASLFVVKKMVLAGLVASGADLYIMASMTALVLGTAVWGRRYARGVLVVGLGVSLFFLLLSLFQLAYEPSAADGMQHAFVVVLGRLSAVTLWSLVAHAVAQITTSRIALALSRFGLVGTFLALSLGQIVDGIIFFGGVFGGTDSLRIVAQMIGVSMALKAVPLLAGTCLVRLALWSKERGYVQ